MELELPFGKDLTSIGYLVRWNNILYRVVESRRDKSSMVGGSSLFLKLEQPKKSIVNCCASCEHFDHIYCTKRDEQTFRYCWCFEFERREDL